VPAGAVPVSSETITLFLVNPVGGRYTIKTFPPGSSVALAAWSADGRRALLMTPADDTTNLILGPPLNGGGVIDALVFPDDH
jgi:TolB protein